MLNLTPATSLSIAASVFHSIYELGDTVVNALFGADISQPMVILFQGHVIRLEIDPITREVRLKRIDSE